MIVCLLSWLRLLRFVPTVCIVRLTVFCRCWSCVQRTVKSRLPISSWTRSNASGAGLARGPRAVNWSIQPQHDGSNEWRTPRVWNCSSMTSHSLTTFAGRSIWCRSSSGPWHPTQSADDMTETHVISTTDRPWSYQHLVFRVLRTSLMPSRPDSVSASPHARPRRHQLTERLSSCVARARHRVRAPQKLDATVSTQSAAIMETRGDMHPPQPEWDWHCQRTQTLLQLRVIYLCDRFGMS